MRADNLPLVLLVLGAQNLPRGAHIRIKLGEIDEISLDITGTLIERLDASADAQAEGDDSGEDDDDTVAGPIAIAVDMNDAEALPPTSHSPDLYSPSP